RFPQALLVKRYRATFEAVLYGEAFPSPSTVVTRSAVNVETFLPALNDRASHREWKRRGQPGVLHSCVEKRVFMKLIAGNGAQRLRPRDTPVLEEGTVIHRRESAAIRHLLFAGAQQQ